MPPIHPGRRQKVAQLGRHRHQIGFLHLRQMAAEAEMALERRFDRRQLLIYLVAAEMRLERGGPVAGDRFDTVMPKRVIGERIRHQPGHHHTVFGHRIEPAGRPAPARLIGQGAGDILDRHALGIRVGQIERETRGHQDRAPAARLVQQIELQRGRHGSSVAPLTGIIQPSAFGGEENSFHAGITACYSPAVTGASRSDRIRSISPVSRGLAK